MEVVLFLMILTLIVIFLSSFETRGSIKIDRNKMKKSILEIEKLLGLADTHLEIELDRMSDQDLSELYLKSGEKFDLYIHERNADNNKQALEDF